LSRAKTTGTKEIATAMATEKQIAANRRNAQLSTGPKSADGKQMSSRNARRGRRARRELLLAGERAAEFDSLHWMLMREYQPVGTVEGELVDSIATDFWRRWRALRLEVALLAAEGDEFMTIGGFTPPQAVPEPSDSQRLCDAFANANRSGADFGKLARYLAMIDGSLHRNLQTLARLQALRRSRMVVDAVASEAETVMRPVAGEAVG
jgi:hypothetical protein